MPIHDFSAQRLFVDHDLSSGVRIACTRQQANYLASVLRLNTGDTVLIFNGRDGEWRAQIDVRSKRDCTLTPMECVREQTPGQDLELAFAPLKRARLDYMVQKAVELGVSRLQPVFTERTIANRVNLERMHANIIEAAEQCGILHLPSIAQPEKFQPLVDGWPSARRLLFCDETLLGADPLRALVNLPPAPTTVLIGPEGGFSPSESEKLRAAEFTVPISLGPRIMRADTAAIAALTLVNATHGDWRVPETR